MSTNTDERRAWVEACLNHIRRQYTERVPLPGPNETEPPASLSLQMLRRLYRMIIAEYAGDR